jgi:acylaminoacyl-peptidase
LGKIKKIKKCLSVIGLDYNKNDLITEEFINKSFKKSPVYYIDNVKTPVLLLLGEDDKRVPIEQGLQFYYSLKSKNVPTKYYLLIN